MDKPGHPFFGADRNSYNIDLDDEPAPYGEKSDGSGRPGIGIVQNAIQFWAGQQDESPTVGDAARVFNMPQEAVAEAVEKAYWMLLGGKDSTPLEQLTIELDGE